MGYVIMLIKKNYKWYCDVYYPNGEVLLEAQYKNGKMNSISRGYRPDGTLFQEIIYKNSKEIKRNIYPQGESIIAYNYQFSYLKV